jgi:hypothetical protein
MRMRLACADLRTPNVSQYCISVSRLEAACSLVNPLCAECSSNLVSGGSIATDASQGRAQELV